MRSTKHPQSPFSSSPHPVMDLPKATKAIEITQAMQKKGGLTLGGTTTLTLLKMKSEPLPACLHAQNH